MSALPLKVLTVSDGVIHGTREDKSGAALEDAAKQAGFDVVERRVTSDGTDEVATALRQLTDGFTGIVVTTGGTGFAPRDLTPLAAIVEVEAECVLGVRRVRAMFGQISDDLRVVAWPKWECAP